MVNEKSHDIQDVLNLFEDTLSASEIAHESDRIRQIHWSISVSGFSMGKGRLQFFSS